MGWGPGRAFSMHKSCSNNNNPKCFLSQCEKFAS